MAPFHGLCTENSWTDAGRLQHRESDERDLDELDARKPAHAPVAVAGSVAGAKADRQPVDRTVGDEARQVVGPRCSLGQPAMHLEPSAVLDKAQPHADRLARIMLEQHAHALGPARLERCGEGAGQDDVAPLIDDVEEAGIAMELVGHGFS
jgi:hypothetical protein